MITIKAFREKLKIRAKRLMTKSNRNVLCELTRAYFKITDHNSILGVFWSFIGPIALLAVMYLIFKSYFGKGIHAYPLYLLIGVISVNFFVTATTYIVRIFYINRDFTLNAMICRETIILSNVAIFSYKFLIELGCCFVLSIFYHLFTWHSLLLIVPLFIAYVALIIGVSFIFSILYCFARDVEHIWMFITRLLFFATPIFYLPDKLSPLAYKFIYFCNPLTPFLISFRQLIMGQPNISMHTYFYCLSLSLGFIIIGCCVFLVFENTAMERI